MTSRLPSEDSLVHLKRTHRSSCERSIDQSGHSLSKHMSSHSDYSIGLQSTKISAVASLTDIFNHKNAVKSLQNACDASVESSLGGSFDGIGFDWECDFEQDRQEDATVEAYEITHAVLNDAAGTSDEAHPTSRCPISDNCSVESSLSKNTIESEFIMNLRSSKKHSAVSSVTGMYKKLFRDCSRSDSSFESSLGGSLGGSFADFEDDMDNDSSVKSGDIDEEVARVQALILKIKGAK
ncbi:MAG: hypothetical protein SGILL_007070 [Bacillariaceae sp.]